MDLIRFWGVGVVTVAFQFLVLILCIEFLNFYPTPSSAIGFIAACVVNYLLLYYWAFLAGGRHQVVLVKYVFTMLLTMGINVFIFWFLTKKSGVWYVHSQAVATLISSLFSFTVNRNYTFV